MIIYLDLVLLLNFFFNFVLLFATNYLLKRDVRLYRIILGSISGSLTILFLFLPLSTISLMVLKLLTSILMILITFSYKGFLSFLKNMAYFYMISIFLGGFLYFVKLRFSLNNDGIIFYQNGIGLNVVAILFLTPIILYLYIKEVSSHKVNYNNYQAVTIYLNENTYSFMGYIDTGNHLRDPLKGRSIILLYTEERFDVDKFFYVPFKTLNSSGVVKCFSVEKVMVGSKLYTDMLIGLSKEKFHIEGVDCILPNNFKEDFDVNSD